jgi:hypothetical protein
MINYNRYFDEWDMPPSGIDRLSTWIHPELIGKFQEFHNYGNNNAAITLRVKSENGYSTDYFIDIQAEALNPYEDLFEQLLSYLTELSYTGILKVPENRGKEEIKNYFRDLFPSFFALNCIEFYFDFEWDDMYLARIQNPQFETTRYSSDFPRERKSILKAYNRPARLKQKKHICYDTIDMMQYPERIEFSLKRRNCQYLHHGNLSGVYQEVFQRYLPFLAKRWRTYGREVAEVRHVHQLSYAANFRQIVETSWDDAIPHARLLKTPPRPKPFHRCGPQDVDRNWIVQFTTGQWK